MFNTNKKCFIKINVESSSQEIWIRFRFLEKKCIFITDFKSKNFGLWGTVTNEGHVKF